MLNFIQFPFGEALEWQRKSTFLISHSSFLISIGLTLTELEATACLGLTRLLALYLTAVASQESGVLQLLLVLLVDLHQGAGNGEAQGLALTSETATVEVDSGCFTTYCRMAEGK